MFVGHFGAGLAAKRVAPRVSLGTLVLAVLWADLLWQILLLLGIEHVGALGLTLSAPVAQRPPAPIAGRREGVS